MTVEFIANIGSDNSIILDLLSDSITGEYENTGVTMTFTMMRRVARNGSMSAGSASLTASGNFVVGDVGKSIMVPGAGAGGSDLRTTIAAFVSATNVTLTDAATLSVSRAAIEVSITGAEAIAMTYVAESDGKYMGTLDEGVKLKNGEPLWLEITTDAGDDKKDFRRLEGIAKYRTKT